MQPSEPRPTTDDATDTRPILVVPYMWIGDFVRCHSVVRTLKTRWPQRPVDVLTNALQAPLLDYMPGVRQGVISALPRKRLALRQQLALARRLRAERYGTALVMPRTWKGALAPFLAGIPERVGFVGEARFIVLNDVRWGERNLPRMVDQCGALALPKTASPPKAWPAPELRVPHAQIAAWRARRGVADGRPLVALAPGSVAASRRWPAEYYGAVARQLDQNGFRVVVLGGPAERPLASTILECSGGKAEDLTGDSLRDAILGLGASHVVISNDSGLLHIAAAIGTPTIGIFGPTSPYLWAPLNPLAATLQAREDIPCRPCHKPVCFMRHHRCMREIATAQVLQAARRLLPGASLAVGT